MTKSISDPDLLSEFYVTGGTMSSDAESYVSRHADEELFEGLKAGRFCYVLTSRQMGKSSLMVRTREKLRDEGFEVVVLDLTTIGQNVTPEQWYDGLQFQIGSRLKLEEELNEFWLANGRIGPLQRWMRAMREVVLVKCRKPIVIFIDEVDVVHSLNFSTSEFFAAIRACYNSRDEDQELLRLNFCLIGVTTTSDLIRDVKTTPLNVGGSRIELADFNEENTKRLADNLGRDPETNQQLIKRILYWTGGHPYLTQRLCKEVADHFEVRDSADIDRVCRKHFLTPGARDTEDNLVFVRDRILRSGDDVIGLLGLHSRILKGKRVPNDNLNPFVKTLRLSGITRTTADGNLIIRNRIYQTVFDENWIAENMPDAELRKQQALYRRKLVGLGMAATLVIMVLASTTTLAYWQKRKADITVKQLGVTQESLARTEESLKRTQVDLEKREKRLNDEILKRNKDIKIKDESLARQEVELIAKTEAARRQTDTAIFLKKVADEKTSAVTRLEYDAKMKLANALYEEGSVESVEKTLADIRDAKNRGLEWNLLDHRLKGLVPFELEDPKEPVHDLLFSPDGKYIIARSGAGFSAWDSSTGKKTLLVPEIKGSRVSSSNVVFSQDGKMMASCETKGELSLWDTTSQPWKKTVISLKREAHSNDDERCRYLSFMLPADSSPALSPSVLMIVSELWKQKSDEEPELVFVLRRFNLQRAQLEAPVVIEQPGSDLEAIHPSVIGFAFDRFLVIRGLTHVALLDATKGMQSLPLVPLRERDTSFSFSPVSAGEPRLAISDKLFYEGRVSVLPIFKSISNAKVLENSEVTDGWRQIIFSPDGKLLAGLSWQEVRIWNAETAKLVRTIPLKQNINSSIAFSPESLRLVVGGSDNDGVDLEQTTLKIWDIYSRDDVFTFNNERPLAFSSDGSQLVTMLDGLVTLWNTLDKRGSRIAAISAGYNAQRVNFSADSRHVTILFREWSPSKDVRTLRLWDASGGEIKLSSRVECKFTPSIAFSTDGQRLMGVCEDNTLRMWSVESGNEVQKLNLNVAKGEPLRDNPTVRMVEQGKKLLIIDVNGPFLGAWNIETGARLELGVCGETLVTTSNDGKWLISRDHESNYFLRTETNNQCNLKPLVAADDIQGAARDIIGFTFSDGDEYLAFSYYLKSDDQYRFDALVRYVVRDLRTTEDILSVSLRDAPNARPKISPSGRWVVFGKNYWNLKTGRKETLEGCVDRLTFSADERRLLTGCDDGNIKFWDLETGQDVLKLRAHDSSVRDLKVMSNDKSILTIGKDVKLWKLSF